MSRELKMVHVNCTALYLRLLLHKCHINPYNYYNQVGIVALNVIGKVGHTYHQTPTPYALETGAAPMDHNEPAIDLSEMKPAAKEIEEDVRYGIQFDPITQKKMRELTIIKQRAVQEEDYDTAKRMKVMIDALKQVGSQLLLLENQKKQAVQKEDYDLAKSLKLQIDQLRSSAQGVGHSHVTQERSMPPPQPACLPPMEGMKQGASTTPSTPQPLGSHPLPPLSSSTPIPSPMTKSEPPPQQVRAVTPPVPPLQPRSMLSNGIEERPAISKAYLSHLPSDLQEDDDQPPKASWDIERVMNTDDPFNTKGGPAHDAHDAHAQSYKSDRSDSKPINEWEKDLYDRIVAQWPEAAGAEELPDAKKRTCSEFTSCFGSFATKCLFSKKWQAREAALKGIAGKISAGGGDAHPFPSDVAQCTILLLRQLTSKGNGLNDAVNGVVTGSMEAVRVLVESDLPHSTQPAFHQIASALVVKAADGNQRTREMSTELLMLLATSPVYGPEKVSSIVLHEPEAQAKKKVNQSQWRPLLARVTLVTLLLDKFGLHRKEVRSVLTVDAMMTKLALPAVNHPNPDSREAGIKLIAKLHQLGAAKSVAKHLVDLKPALKAVIEKECEGNEGLHLSSGEREMMNSSMSIDGNDQMKQQLRAARAAQSPQRRPQPDPVETEAVEDTECQFCKKQDSRFTLEVLDRHYLHSCPMLYQCHLCSQVIEIMLLTDHWLMECTHRDAMKQCPNCLEAIPTGEYEDHLNKAACSPPSDSCNLCVLCKAVIGPGDLGWDEHLLKGCPANPRKLNNPDPPEFRM
eukprot:TRINITY_DN6722_c0_g1_i2.p1 TRINITY_DN6722_c0_g1~~TRINITY_DN6722_c0_g1_i2.p1  ORF type:complete len:935 (+),score=309.11 TRINITY_DN6722_c0_g1_i2:409-2805(+)